MENIFSTLNIAGQGMSIQRKRLTAVANNIANVNTTVGVDGKPYQREVVVSRSMQKKNFTAELENQITLVRTDMQHSSNGHIPLTDIEKNAVIGDTVKDNKPPRMVYDPGHPDADPAGYVHYPDINIVTEMVDMITAQRGFEANTQMVNTAKNLARYTLEI